MIVHCRKTLEKQQDDESESLAFTVLVSKANLEKQ